MRVDVVKDVFSRNFEALKRAEEQLEREDLARKEVGFCFFSILW